jgi:hypothetical protein
MKNAYRNRRKPVSSFWDEILNDYQELLNSASTRARVLLERAFLGDFPTLTQSTYSSSHGM